MGDARAERRRRRRTSAQTSLEQTKTMKRTLTQKPSSVSAMLVDTPEPIAAGRGLAADGSASGLECGGLSSHLPLCRLVCVCGGAV